MFDWQTVFLNHQKKFSCLHSLQMVQDLFLPFARLWTSRNKKRNCETWRHPSTTRDQPAQCLSPCPKIWHSMVLLCLLPILRNVERVSCCPKYFFSREKSLLTALTSTHRLEWSPFSLLFYLILCCCFYMVYNGDSQNTPMTKRKRIFIWSASSFLYLYQPDNIIPPSSILGTILFLP